MNNRYICKAKRKDNGEWVEGFLYITHNGEYEISNYDEGLDTERITCIVIPETVGQCIGLKDKNGKLIFEGDVVEDKDSGLFGKVVFATSADGFDGMTGFMVDDVDDGLQNYNGFLHLVEVIGNIYDTPNLLKLEHDSLCETETYKVGDTK